MPRLSDRISAALSTVTCPSCHQQVVPTDPAPVEAAPESKEGARFSYIWIEPGGKVCPECTFPLDRYARRVKWLETFVAGIGVLTLWVVLGVLSTGLQFPVWLRWVQVGLAGVGTALFLVGVVGLLLGGRRRES